MYFTSKIEAVFTQLSPTVKSQNNCNFTNVDGCFLHECSWAKELCKVTEHLRWAHVPAFCMKYYFLNDLSRSKNQEIFAVPVLLEFSKVTNLVSTLRQGSSWFAFTWKAIGCHWCSERPNLRHIKM